MAYIGKVVAGGATHLVGSTLYGTCSTAAGTVAKVVVSTDFTELVTGVTIHIKFTYTNTAASPTLTIQNAASNPTYTTGAKAIMKYGTTAAGTTAATSWYAGTVVALTYDGTNWIMNDHIDDTNNDTQVTQIATTANAEYEVLFSTTADNTTHTGSARKSDKLKFNPSTGTLTATKVTTPAITLNGNDLATTLGELTAKEQTNEDNILSLYNQNGKTFNLFDINRPIDVAYHAAAVVADNAITVGTVSGDWAYVGIKVLNLPAGSYRVSGKISNLVTGATGTTRIVVSQYSSASQGSLTYINITQNGDFSGNFTWTGGDIYLLFYVNNSTSSSANYTYTASDLQIISTSAYNAGFTEYQPYTLSNAELTSENKINKNSISLLRAYGGLKNYATINNGTYTANSGGGTHSVTIPLLNPITGDIVISIGNITSNDVDSSTCAFVFENDITSRETVAVSRGNNINVLVSMGTFVATKVQIYPAASYQTSNGDTVSWTDLMICTKEDWDNSHDYQPYAMSNAELTTLYKVGSANILKNTAQTQTVGGVTFTINANGTITANGTKTDNEWLYLSTGNSLKRGTYVLSSGGIIGDDKLVIVTTGDTLGTAIMTTDTVTGVYERTLTQDYSNLYYAIRIARDTVCNNVTFKPMLCEKNVYDAINGEFQPYAMSNTELTTDVASLAAKSQKTISSSGNTSKLRLTLNTSAMSNANRGSLLLSIPFQTSSYDNALLLIAIGNDSFLGVQRLDNSNNSMVTSWALSANNTILDITLRAQPWSAPVAFPLAQAAPPITYSWES